MNRKSLLTSAAFLLMGSAASAADTAFAFDSTSAELNEFSETGGALRTVIRFSFYIMYLIGGLMLAASGFKLKAGDMPGFYKMAAGGVFIFLAPFLIQALVNLSSATDTASRTGG